MRLWREWLPEDVAREATEEEPKRFAAIVAGWSKEWQQHHDPALTLKWLSLFNRHAPLTLDVPLLDSLAPPSTHAYAVTVQDLVKACSCKQRALRPSAMLV